MTIEQANRSAQSRPWGVLDVQGWGDPRSDGFSIGEIADERSAPAENDPALLQQPKYLSRESAMLRSGPYFVFERIDLTPAWQWRLDAAREPWHLVRNGTAQRGSFALAKGEAVFVQADTVASRAEPAGVTSLVPYTGAGGPASLLLQRRRGRYPAETTGVIILGCSSELAGGASIPQ